MAGYNITKRSLCVKTVYLLHGANQAHKCPRPFRAVVRSLQVTLGEEHLAGGYSTVIADGEQAVDGAGGDGSLRSFRCFLSLVNYGTFGCKVPSERSVDDVPLGGVMLPL